MILKHKNKNIFNRACVLKRVAILLVKDKFRETVHQ